ncbi:MAG: CoA transferase subunit A [Deltaproteobacteria bacterium]|nr:CoA transferase subunit A [Deltaproteobacteria bacterium]
MGTIKTDTKVMALDQAIRRYVTHADHITIGGFTLSRNPMAAIHEIIRQGICELHIYIHSNGQGFDELVGAGCISKAEIAYSGNGRFAPTCFCFKRQVINNKIMVEDYTNFQMALRFLAGAMGVPFLPTTSCLGTDIINKWGFDIETRKNNSRLSSKKLVVMDNPFSKKTAPEKIVLVPAINPDVTIIHAQRADTTGTTRINGLTFSDIEQAKASKSVIVTCDELLNPGLLNHDPGNNQLPSFCVDAVVHIPFGAYPTACYGLYDYDAQFLDLYRSIASSQERFNLYIKDFILGTKDHAEFIEKACGNRLEQIKADPETGYSDRIKRN